MHRVSVCARAAARRRCARAAALGIGLVSVGAVYTLLVPRLQIAIAADDGALIGQGQQIFDHHCISCHGANLQGVPERAPSLIGVGSAAVYFQVSTGHMPLARQQAQAPGKHPAPEFDPRTPRGAHDIDALDAFVQANGGGPQRPTLHGAALRGLDPARGGELFRLNCASCHNFTGQGGALSSGKSAPPLSYASPDQIYTAMLTGPESMPRFSERQLNPTEKRDIIAYIDTVTHGHNDPGGEGLGDIGPVSEGLIAWVFGITAMVAVALWIGAKT